MNTIKVRKTEKTVEPEKPKQDVVVGVDNVDNMMSKQNTIVPVEAWVPPSPIAEVIFESEK